MKKTRKLRVICQFRSNQSDTRVTCPKWENGNSKPTLFISVDISLILHWKISFQLSRGLREEQAKEKHLRIGWIWRVRAEENRRVGRENRKKPLFHSAKVTTYNEPFNEEREAAGMSLTFWECSTMGSFPSPRQSKYPRMIALTFVEWWCVREDSEKA